MYCINCGQQLPDNARFCNKCGTKTIQSANDLSVENQPLDMVAVKVEEFVAEDATLSFNPEDVNDLVAKKAAFIGEEPTELLHHEPKIALANIIEGVRQYVSSISESKEQVLYNYLFRIKRNNLKTNESTYCLLNSQTDTRSEWFDKIWYHGNDIFGVERNGETGFLETDANTYQLYDEVIKISHTHYAGKKDEKWVIITIQNKKIVLLTQHKYDIFTIYSGSLIIIAKHRKYKFFQYINGRFVNTLPVAFDDFYNCRDGVFIVKRNNKYGYVFYENQILNRYIECLLDEAAPFSNRYNREMAKVTYNGNTYLLDKEGGLWKKSWSTFFLMMFFITWFLGVFAFGASWLYTKVFDFFSWRDPTNIIDCWIVWSVVFVIVLVHFIRAEGIELLDNYKRSIQIRVKRICQKRKYTSN